MLQPEEEMLPAVAVPRHSAFAHGKGWGLQGQGGHRSGTGDVMLAAAAAAAAAGDDAGSRGRCGGAQAEGRAPSRLQLLGGGLPQLSVCGEALLPNIDEGINEAVTPTPCITAIATDAAKGSHEHWGGGGTPFLGGDGRDVAGRTRGVRGCGKRGRADALISPPDSTISCAGGISVSAPGEGGL